MRLYASTHSQNREDVYIIMGDYPRHYPDPAVHVAKTVVNERIPYRVSGEDGIWTGPNPLIDTEDFEEIHARFIPGTRPEEVLRLIGLVFTKEYPRIHFPFVSDGYFLALSENSIGETIVVIDEHPPSVLGYQDGAKHESRVAALTAVRALVEWNIATFMQSSNDSSKWPFALIPAELYQVIRLVSQIVNPRPWFVASFVEQAVPELRDQWVKDGLKLVPNYHIGHKQVDRSVSLQLVRHDRQMRIG